VRPDERHYSRRAAAGTGTVEFRDVEFRYPGAEDPVLRNISFTARPGQTTAIVGSTGAGKTTLVNLIPRLYDATSGAVLVDGIDVKEMRRDELWKESGFIPQKACLLSGTGASTLRARMAWPCPAYSRARLIAALSSQDRAPWRRARSCDCLNSASAATSVPGRFSPRVSSPLMRRNSATYHWLSVRAVRSSARSAALKPPARSPTRTRASAISAKNSRQVKLR